MLPRKMLLVLVLIASAVVVSLLAYNYLRSQESSLAVEASVGITHYDLNRKTSTLVGVNLTSQSESPITLVSAKMVKVQSGIAVASTTFASSFSLAPNGTVTLPLSFKLDPEGADYTLYIFTSKNTVVKGTLSYP